MPRVADDQQRPPLPHDLQCPRQGDSLANEPGLQRFEVIADEQDPNVFYLNEVYTDLDAFNARASGPYFAAFFAEASTYAKGPAWLMRGNLVGEQVPA